MAMKVWYFFLIKKSALVEDNYLIFPVNAHVLFSSGNLHLSIYGFDVEVQIAFSYFKNKTTNCKQGQRKGPPMQHDQLYQR